MTTDSLPRAEQSPPVAATGERQTVWTATASLLEAQSQSPPLRRGQRRLQSQLSFSQERLWFLHRADPRSAAYNVIFAWRVIGPLDVPALEAALNRIVQRHTAFQTAFREENGTPTQVISGACRIHVTQELIAIEDWVTEPFDISKPPLMRANVVFCGGEEHYLTIVIHHLIFDGWSRMLFTRELNAEYSAALHGRASAIAEPTVQYADYATWHREWLDAGVVADQMAYWRGRLARSTGQTGPQHGLELPSDRPRGTAAARSGAALFLSLPKRLYFGVDRLRKELMTTRFVVLLAAFKALLHRYTGEEDIVIGSVAANRNRIEVRNIIGCFVNTVVLRSHVSPTIRFRDLLATVEETARGAFANQEVPFERIVTELKPERSPNRSPLFQVMFALQNTGPTTLHLEGTRARPIPVHTGCAKFDLSVELAEQSGGITACIEYDAALFDRATIHRMAMNYSVLLQGAIDNPDCPLNELPLLGRAEKRQLLSTFNNTATDYPRNATVPALFDEVVSSHGQRLAICDGPTRWTYSELKSRADSVACALLAAGVKPGTLVAVTGLRHADTIAAILGILKAGGAYVPVDMSTPLQRIRFVIEDSGATLILAHRSVTGTLSGCNAQVLCIEDVLDRRASASDENRETGRSDDPAYVLYTSGSTGTPKGVSVPHRAIVRLVRNTNYIELGPDDVVAQAASLAFDAATFEIWGALLNGARLEIVEKDAVLSPAQLSEAIHRAGITTLFLTTSVFNLVASEAPAAFRPLRNLLFGGEAADPSSVRAVLRHGRPQRLLNVYGPTETTTFATWHEIVHLPENAVSVPIGKPISNTKVHLLDSHGSVVPIGVRGEIHIGGDGLALGYLGRPALTEERFVHREIPPGVQETLYRTGDFAVRKSNGVIEFIGRADDQIKLRGFRIELGEIETALRQFPEVRECCVLLRDDPATGRQLVAYVSPAEKTALTGSECRDWLSERLPDYMLPAAYTVLPKLPLNQNGKIDRAALPAPDSSTGQTIAAEAHPWIALHLQLISIWEDLLNVRPIGLRDDFFDVGGHSLLAVRLMDRIEQVCGVRLPISTLFSASTVEALSAAILALNRSCPPIAQVQQDGNKAPVFFLHGDLFGGGLYCRQLAKQIGSAHGFFALPPRACGDDGKPLSIQAIAAEHVRSIQEFRPAQPCIVGGFCVSAIIALEVAHQLRECGQEVEMVAMIDPPSPRSLWWLRRLIESRTTGETEWDQINDFSRGFRQVYRARELWGQSAIEKLQWFTHSLRRSPAQAGSEQDAPLESAASAYLWATAGYRPKRYDGCATVICCDSVMGTGPSRVQQWSQYLPNAMGHALDCKHLELVTTRSDDVAAIIRAELPEAHDLRLARSNGRSGVECPAGSEMSRQY